MFLLLAACAPSPELDTFVPVTTDLGPAWAWSADPSLVVAVGDDPDGVWTPGLYVRHGDDLVASFAAAPDLRDAAWVPPVLATPRDPARLEDEPGLALDLVAPAGNGCDDTLVARVSPSRAGGDVDVDIALSGAPTLAAAPVGVAWIDGVAHDLALVDASGRYVEEVSTVETDAFFLTADPPIPRIGLRAVGGYVAIETDAACARERGWSGELVLSVSL